MSSDSDTKRSGLNPSSSEKLPGSEQLPADVLGIRLRGCSISGLLLFEKKPSQQRRPLVCLLVFYKEVTELRVALQFVGRKLM
jgi:hypothetical protein